MSICEMMNQEQATAYKENPKPWAPKDREDAIITMPQAMSIKEQMSQDWDLGIVHRSIAGD